MASDETPHGPFKGWEYHAARRQLAERLGHPEWAELASTRARAHYTGFYWTGIPCKHGHQVPRYQSGNCMECIKNAI